MYVVREVVEFGMWVDLYKNGIFFDKLSEDCIWLILKWNDEIVKNVLFF